MMSDFESMKHLALKQVQEELRNALCAAIMKEGRDKEDFMQELRVLEGENMEEMCSNKEREFTTAIPMLKDTERWFYITIKPSIVTKYLCPWIGNMTDCYVGKVRKPDDDIVYI